MDGFLMLFVCVWELSKLPMKLWICTRLIIKFEQRIWNDFCVSGFQFWMQGSRPVVQVVHLGLVSYQQALRLQQVYVNQHRSGVAHALLLCQHPPVYTTGIRHKPYPAHLLDRLHQLGADVHRTNRGGLITFHGPGQLVCYPVLNLTSFKKVWNDLLLSWM